MSDKLLPEINQEIEQNDPILHMGVDLGDLRGDFSGEDIVFRLPIIQNSPFSRKIREIMDILGEDTYTEYRKWVEKVAPNMTYLAGKDDYYWNWRKHIEDFWEWRAEQ